VVGQRKDGRGVLDGVHGGQGAGGPRVRHTGRCACVPAGGRDGGRAVVLASAWAPLRVIAPARGTAGGHGRERVGWRRC
jgi:hypothetical protein